MSFQEVSLPPPTPHPKAVLQPSSGGGEPVQGTGLASALGPLAKKDPTNPNMSKGYPGNP